MPAAFELRQIETLDNFMSLKHGISNAEVAEFEALFFPDGVNRTVTEADIDHIERTLDCRLPEDYKSFLREYGYAAWFGHTIYGISPIDGADIESYNYSAVENTQHVRANENADLIAALDRSIVIGSDQIGGYFVIDPADSRGQSQIRWIDHETDFSTVETWPSFLAYVEHYYRASYDADACEIG